MWGQSVVTLTLYHELGHGLHRPPGVGVGLTGPGPGVPLLEAGDPQPTLRVRLEPAPLRVVPGLEREGVAGGRGPPAAPPSPPTPHQGLRPLQPHQAGLLPAPGPGHHAHQGLRRGGGELALHHGPHLALPDPVILQLHGLDQEGARVWRGRRTDPAILPDPASAYRVDRLVRGLPQTDGGVDGGPAGEADLLARAGDDLWRGW